MQRAVQDIDSGGRQSSLPWHGECLEQREETANISSGAAGLVPASHPGGHSCSSRNHQHLPEGSGTGSVAAGWWGRQTVSKPAIGVTTDFGVELSTPRPENQDLVPGDSAKPAIEVTTGFGVELRGRESENPSRHPSASACKPFQEAIKLGLGEAATPWRS